MGVYTKLISHQGMVFDEVRNAAYAKALKKSVNSHSLVLDLGAGVGIHGMIAAVCGARKVYLVEKESVIEVASRIANENGLGDKVKCFRGRIQETRLPEKVDIIISVLTGNFLLTEDLLPSLFFARDNYLAPGGRLIPDRARMLIVPVNSQKMHQKHIASWSKGSAGVSVSSARPYAANSIIFERVTESDVEFLANPAVLMEMDFLTVKTAECRRRIELDILNDGLCHGVLGWFDIGFDEDWLSTSPHSDKTHWSQAFLPLDPPVEVSAGRNMVIEVQRPEYGDWTWTVCYDDIIQRHSTFLATPLAPADLSLRSKTFSPLLSRKGEAARYLLTLMDGSRQVSTLSQNIFGEFPDVFLTENEAEQFVKKMVVGFA